MVGNEGDERQKLKMEKKGEEMRVTGERERS